MYTARMSFSWGSRGQLGGWHVVICWLLWGIWTQDWEMIQVYGGSSWKAWWRSMPWEWEETFTVRQWAQSSIFLNFSFFRLGRDSSPLPVGRVSKVLPHCFLVKCQRGRILAMIIRILVPSFWVLVIPLRHCNNVSDSFIQISFFSFACFLTHFTFSI